MSSVPSDRDLSGFVFGGYLVTRPVERAELSKAGLLLERVTTASDCLAKFLPDTWALSWSADEERRAECVAAFGIELERVNQLVSLVDDLFNAQRVLWARFVTDMDAVASILRAAAPKNDCVLLGLALHESLVDSFVKDVGEVQAPESMIVGQLTKRLPIPEGGTLLGYEILGFELGATNAHSWLCNNLHETLADRHGERPGPLGLLTDYSTADRWADEATREQPGEPLLWLPWALVQFPLPRW
ncbi:MAG: hypothetical protein JW751_10900 [Polyangiaceae bacterium]|nr:hypothetical protein [Polyangiaceae bacterium]